MPYARRKGYLRLTYVTNDTYAFIYPYIFTGTWYVTLEIYSYIHT